MNPGEIVSLRTALGYLAHGDSRATRVRLAVILVTCLLSLAGVAVAAGLAVVAVLTHLT